MKTKQASKAVAIPRQRLSKYTDSNVIAYERVAGHFNFRYSSPESYETNFRALIPSAPIRWQETNTSNLESLKAKYDQLRVDHLKIQLVFLNLSEDIIVIECVDQDGGTVDTVSHLMQRAGTKQHVISKYNTAPVKISVARPGTTIDGMVVRGKFMDAAVSQTYYGAQSAIISRSTAVSSVDALLYVEAYYACRGRR